MTITCSKLTPLAALVALVLVTGCSRTDTPSAVTGTPAAGSAGITGATGSAGNSGLPAGSAPAVTGGLGTAGAASGTEAGTAVLGSSLPGSSTGGGASTTPSTAGSPSGAADTPQSPGTGRGTERSGDNGNKKGAKLDVGAGSRLAATDAGTVALTMALTPTQAVPAAGPAGSSAVLGAGPAASGSTMQSSGGVTSPHGGVAGERLPAAADRNFMNNAAIGGIFEVAVGKVAAERASSSAVKRFGSMLVDDHTAANDELAALAAARGIKPPARLPAAKQSKIDRLAKLPAGGFDRQFLKEVGLKDHQDDIRLFEKAAKSARDPELRAFAAKTLPTLRKHHQEAQELLRTIGTANRRAAETQQR